MRIAPSQIEYAFDRVPPVDARMALVKSDVARKAPRLRVLLVEDDDADVYLIRRALAEIPRVGEVRVARDGVEALTLIESWSSGPDLAIVDLKMPRKDGFSLLRDFAVKKYPVFPSVVLTSSKAGADVYRAKKRGAAEFLTKPSSAEKLRALLDLFISKL